MERLTGKLAAPLVVLALGLCLCVPLVGSFGLWDPAEVRVADLAKEVAQSGGWAMRPSAPRPPLPVWIVVAGFKVFGVGELGGRLPVALMSVLALAACYWLGAGFLRRRGALLGAVALATMPAFFLGARQLTTNVMPLLAATLAVGGLARAAWPRPERDSLGPRLLDLAIGVVGLLLGQLSSGTMMGVAVPLTAVGLALVCAGGPLGAWVALLATAAATWVGVLVGWKLALAAPGHPPAYTALLGGTPRPSAHAVTLVTQLVQIGFGGFPWVVLLPLAAARAFAQRRAAAAATKNAPPPTGEIQSAAAGPAPAPPAAPAPEPDEPWRSHARFGKLLLLSWALVAYVAATLAQATVGELAFPALAAIALAAGGWLDEALDEPQPLALAGIVAAVFAAILAHDFFLAPEKWAGAHVLEGIKWPGPLVAAPWVILFLGLAWAGALALGLALKPGRGRELLWAAPAVAVVAALVGVYWVTPSVSKHLSYKGLFTKYKQIGAGSEIGKYRVPGNMVYDLPSTKITDLSGLPQMFQFLAKPSRVFVLAASEELAPIDQYAKQQPAQEKPLYYVVDDSNSRVLLLSNQLGAQESDLNPLKRQIVRALARPPQHEVHADFEGKVELVGYDLPAELQRGRNFKITLYYKVNQPVGGAYKVFLHFDGPGTRFNGDHIPLEGRFPTNYWVPGYYIIDEHEMEPDRATAPSGTYQVFTGMFLGDRRLHVASGPNDGEHRVRLGVVRVK